MTAGQLELIADDPIHHNDRAAIISAIRQAVTMNGVCISSNDIRPYLPLWVYPKVIGATISGLVARRILRQYGWDVSDDHRGSNAGRPVRVYSVDLPALAALIAEGA